MRYQKSLSVILIAAAGLFVGWTAPVKADTVLYDNIPGFPNAYPATNAWCSTCGGSYQVYSPFALSGDSTITGTDFAIQDEYGSNFNINISVWDSALGTNLFSETLAPGQYTLNSTPASNGYGYDIVSAAMNVSLSAGSYYISWADPNNMAIPGWSSGAGGTLLQTYGYGDANPGADICGGCGGSTNEYAAFDIVGNNSVGTPTPGAFALLGFGLFGLGGIHWRKKAS